MSHVMTYLLSQDDVISLCNHRVPHFCALVRVRVNESLVLFLFVWFLLTSFCNVGRGNILLLAGGHLSHKMLMEDSDSFFDCFVLVFQHWLNVLSQVEDGCITFIAKVDGPWFWVLV